MMRLLQLVRALGHKHVRLLHIGLDRIHHRSLLVDEISKLLVDLIHAHDVVLQLPDAALLLLQRLQINLLLHLRLLLTLLSHARAHKVILEWTVVAAAARTAALAAWWTGYRVTGLMRTGLLQCIPFVVHRLSLNRLEGRQG